MRPVPNQGLSKIPKQNKTRQPKKGCVARRSSEFPQSQRYLEQNRYLECFWAKSSPEKKKKDRKEAKELQRSFANCLRRSAVKILGDST